MPTLETVRLAFPGGLHVGTRGVNLEESGLGIPSDTLFAALVDAHRRDGGDPDEWMRSFPRTVTHADAVATELGDPPFLLTSAFPYAGDVRFFPLPAPLQCMFSAQQLKERRKEINAIQFVSEALLRRMLAGEPMDGWLFPPENEQEPRTGVALQGGSFWLALDECEHLPPVLRQDAVTGRRVPPRALRQRRVCAGVRVPRVAVSRVSSASEIFHAGRVSFAPGCGLWFGVQWRAPQMAIGQTTYREAMGRLLATLGDDGIGGERTAGYGAFTWQDGGEITLPDASPGKQALLLSRYHPRAAELPMALSDAVAYTLTPVGGWLRTWGAPAQRRRRLWLVAEGSVIRTMGDAPWGDVTDVRPRYGNPDPTVAFGHPVWRYGLALGVAYQEAHHG